MVEVRTVISALDLKYGVIAREDAVRWDEVKQPGNFYIRFDDNVYAFNVLSYGCI